MPDQPLAEFLALSQVLTGYAGLSESVGALHLAKLQADPFAGPLAAALAKFEALQAQRGDLAGAVHRDILQDDSLAPVAHQIIFLWYAGATFDDTGKVMDFGGAEEYFSGLIWGTIRAHVPGLSGGYFGHWRYATER